MESSILWFPSSANDRAGDPAYGDLTRSVRDALRHLHDPIYLQTHPLGRLLTEPSGTPGSTGQRLNRLLVDAIAALRPKAGVGDARARRRYELLALRYVEALEIADVATRLAISRREYHREHRQALDAVAAILAAGARVAPMQPAPVGVPKVARELAMTAGLPAPSTSFIGREREVVEVLGLIAAARLVTLTGPPGTGKTRLALRVAEALLSPSGADDGAFGDGVAFVSLAPVLDPALVVAAITAALGVPEIPHRSPIDSLIAHLSQRHALLILDNFEQVLDAAPIVARLLTACPHLTVLVTSRASLHLSGGHEFVVPPLALPAPGRSAPLAEVARIEAIHLYVERARAMESGFRLTEQNALAVVEICRRVDGLPLAIELAAARSRVFPPYALLGRLSGDVARQGSPLRLLTRGPRDAPARQQTLRGAIDWSYRLLAADEQRLLARLSVFAGGWNLEALEAVAPADGDLDAIEGVASLLDKSLIQREETADGEPRFVMLETIREFGSERLSASGEETAVRDAHAAWYVGFAERAEAGLAGATRDAWATRVKVEMGNLRAALAWAIERRDADLSLRLAAALSPVWLGHGPYQEGRAWLERSLALAGGPPLARVAVAVALVRLYWLQGYLTEAAMAGEDALALARATTDRRATARALLALGEVLDRQGSLNRATRCQEEALGLFRDLGDTRGIAEALSRLGVVAWVRGDIERYAALAEEALARWREIGDQAGIMSALDSLSLAARLRGDLARQATLAREVLALSQQLDDPLAVASALWTAAAIADERGETELAARFFGAEEALRQEIGFALDPAFSAHYDRQVAGIHARLAPATLTAAWDGGRALGPMQALGEAMALLDRLAAGPAASAAGRVATGLTRREVEVLQLLAEQLTDREIAEHLFISRRTASHHVAAILTKLGAPTRRAAIVEARRRGVSLSAPDGPPAQTPPGNK